MEPQLSRRLVSWRPDLGPTLSGAPPTRSYLHPRTQIQNSKGQARSGSEPSGDQVPRTRSLSKGKEHTRRQCWPRPTQGGHSEPPSRGSPSPAEAERRARGNPAPSPNNAQGPPAFPSDLGRSELRPPRPPARSTRRVRAPSAWNPAHLCSLGSDTEGVSGPPPTEALARPTPPAPSSAGVAAGSA